MTAPAPSRMTLAAVRGGKLDRPKRILLYGVEKVGKSTFAADTPSPVFLCAEDGTAELDVQRFPQPESWPDACAAIEELIKNESPYKTLVIDTLDWLEPMLWEHICQRDSMRNIEEYGYGKGYVAALTEWRIMLSRLDKLRNVRGTTVMLLAHSWIKPFKNPLGDDYDRFELKLHAKAAGLIKEWCDAVLFARLETFAVKKEGRVRGIASGSRVMHAAPAAAWDAGNRFGLPDSMPLSWDEFIGAASRGAAAIEALTAEVHALFAQVDRATKTAGEKWLAQNGRATDPGALAQMVDRLRGKITVSETPKEEAGK